MCFRCLVSWGDHATCAAVALRSMVVSAFNHIYIAVLWVCMCVCLVWPLQGPKRTNDPAAESAGIETTQLDVSFPSGDDNESATSPASDGSASTRHSLVTVSIDRR